MTLPIRKQFGSHERKVLLRTGRVRDIARVFVVVAVLQAATIQVAAGQGGTIPGRNGPNQVRTLTFGVQVLREVRSGDVDEYSFTAGAGDLVSGTIEVR